MHDSGPKKPNDLSEPLRRIYEQVTTFHESAPGEAEAEVKQLEDMLLKDPENPDLKEWLAFKLYSAGQFLRAAQLYRDLIAKAYRPGVQYFYLGNTLYKMKRTDEAMEAWQKTVELIPQDPKAQKAKARLDKARKEKSAKR